MYLLKKNWLFTFGILFFWLFYSVSFPQSRDSTDKKKTSGIKNNLINNSSGNSKLNYQDSLSLDSLKRVIAADSVIPINNYYFSDELIDKNINADKFLFNNSLGFYAQLNEQPDLFFRDLGMPSNFSEIIVNGFGIRNTSCIFNGRNFLEPFTNTINLLNINFEEMETFLTVSSPKAFLYGTLNEPVSFRFFSKDFYSKIPYSRFKYIEAPYDNLFFDGIFNVFPFKKLNFEFGITKNSTKGRFKNSEYDTWKGRLKFTYFYSNKLNIILSYRYSQIINQFNEGVNLTAIVPSSTQKVDDILFDELQAPVVNLLANQDNIRNDIDIEFRGNFLKDSLSLSYLNFYFSENKRNFSNLISNFHYSKILGINLRQYLFLSFLHFEFIFDYQNRIVHSPFIPAIRENYISLVSLVKINLYDKFKPSLFTKFFNFDNLNGFNFGADFTYLLSDNIKIYSGGSNFFILQSPDAKYYQINKYDYTNTINLNTKVNFNFSILDLSIEGYYYHKKQTNLTKNFPFTPYIIDSINNIFITGAEKSEIIGGSLSGSIKIWNFLFSFSNSIISKKQIDNGTYKLLDQPEFLSNVSLMYKDIVFDNSLEINAGFKLNYHSQFDGYVFSPEKVYFVNIKSIDTVQTDFSKVKINANYKLDFVLSGRIKKAATLFFALENITNNKYYLSPYYPIKDFGISFGVAWEFWN